MKQRPVYYPCLTILTVLFISGCKHAPTQPRDTTFSLTVDDANCTEVFLRLQLGSGIDSREVTLKRDSVVLYTSTIDETDTTLVDTGLLPNHSYTYTASVGGNVQSCTAATMDTTSHAFSFTTTLLGDGTGSSQLFDDAIINDTLAYAVGDIYQGGTEHNVAQWDGQTWRSMQLLYQGFPPIVRSILAISDSNIWFDPWIHWNGQTFLSIQIDPVLIGIGVNKMWGDSNDMYVVGNIGLIAHYNGNTWAKIESGTTLDVRDIYGAQNSGTGAWKILATAGNPLISPERKVIQITGTTAQTIPDIGIGGGLNGIWLSPGHYYWLVGDGVWEKHPTLSDPAWHSQSLSPYTIHAVRGNGSNDIFMCGAFGEVLHFNGVSWKSYQTQIGVAALYVGLAVRGNTVVMVGQNNGQAVITIGKR